MALPCLSPCCRRWSPRAESPIVPVTHIWSPGCAPERRTSNSGDCSPRTVRESTSGPDVEQVSPPIKCTPNCSARCSIPLMQVSRKSRVIAGGIARESRKYRGLPPMAAMSERLTDRVFFPKDSGSQNERSKWIPSISMSVVMRLRRPGEGVKAAASSPMPRTTPVPADTCRAIRSMRPNSPSVLRSAPSVKKLPLAMKVPGGQVPSACWVCS